jgi:hypothetical protein
MTRRPGLLQQNLPKADIEPHWPAKTFLAAGIVHVPSIIDGSFSKSLPGTSPIFAKRATSGASAAEGAGKRQCKSRRGAALDALEGIGLTPR